MRVIAILMVGQIEDLIEARLNQLGTPLKGTVTYSYTNGRSRLVGNRYVINERGAYLCATCQTATGTKEFWHGDLIDLIKANLAANGHPTSGEVVFSHYADRFSVSGNKVVLGQGPNGLEASCESYIQWKPILG